MVLCLVLSAASGFGQYKVDRLLLSGRIALHYEDYVLSIQYFNQAINQKPYLWEPWQLRSIAKFYLDDWQGAETDASKAIELNPYVAELFDLRGISRIRQSKYEDAIGDYTKAIALLPDNQNYWYNRAACYMECGKYDEAQSQLDTLITRWNKSASAYLLKAQTFIHQKDTTSAAMWIDKALEIDKYNVEAWRVRASIALSREEWKKADEFLSQVIYLKPKDYASYSNRALARLKVNNLRGAMDDYNMSLDINPNNFLAHYNRGLLRQQVGDDNRAIEDFNYVLELEPGNIMALFNRATLLDRTGNLRAAIRDYSIVIDKFPNFWTGLQHRASCYRRLGMTAKAEKDEFRILKAQMDKHIGIQQRWSKNKLNAMRKLSDIDPEKYNHIVVEDTIPESHEYKSEYRGKVQNRTVSEAYQPYISMTINSSRIAMSSYTPFDKSVEDYRQQLSRIEGAKKAVMPVLGYIGVGQGISTFDAVDSLTHIIQTSHATREATLLLLLRSIAYSSAMNYEAAQQDLDNILAIEPDNLLAVWQSAVCHAMKAEFDDLVSPMERQMLDAGVNADFRKAEELDPHNAYLLYNHGTYLARRGQYKEAIQLFSKSLGINPDLPLTYFNRGLAFLQSGDIVSAKRDLSIAGEKGIVTAYSLIKKK